MAYTINSTKYPPRKPKLDITADSLDDVAALTNIAEGSTLTVGEDHYEYDSVDGWVAPGGGGGGGSLVVGSTTVENVTTLDKTAAEIETAFRAGKSVVVLIDYEDDQEYYSYTVLKIASTTSEIDFYIDYTPDGSIEFAANSGEDYPTHTWET